jgi:hypothetical protein
MVACSPAAVRLTQEDRTLLEDAIEQDLNTDARIASEIEQRSERPHTPLRAKRAVLQWLDGRVWHVILDAPSAPWWHLRVEGRRYTFRVSDRCDPNGVPIWIECPRAQPV